MTDCDDVFICFIDVIPRMFHTLMQGFESPAALHAGINRTQMRTLLTLARAGELTLSQLSWHVGIERGSMTAVASKLVSVDLIGADRDASDRRKILVSLTPRGEDLARACTDDIRSTLAERFSMFPEEDRIRISEACRQLRMVFERHEKELP